MSKDSLSAVKCYSQVNSTMPMIFFPFQMATRSLLGHKKSYRYHGIHILHFYHAGLADIGSYSLAPLVLGPGCVRDPGLGSWPPVQPFTPSMTPLATTHGPILFNVFPTLLKFFVQWGIPGCCQELRNSEFNYSADLDSVYLEPCLAMVDYTLRNMRAIR
jgi:hypothetical protein